MCPLCSTETETQDHVFRCGSAGAVTARESALWNFEDELVRAKTHPDITTLMVMAVKGEYDKLRYVGLSEVDDVVEAACQQGRIGWHLVLYGVLSNEWATVQGNWDRQANNNGAGTTNKSWTKVVQNALWNYVREVWEHRNKKVHGETDEEICRVRTERLRRECVSLASQGKSVGTEDRHLTIIRLDNKGSMFLHHWRRMMKNAVRKEALRGRQQVRTQTEDLFRQVRTRQRGGVRLRQRSMDEFVARSGVETGVSERSTLGLVPGMGLQNVRVLAQRELAPCDGEQVSATEE